eukprot:CAMPEP_0178987004 /NCGR_PEP_ID=MMETSP0795-20121207/3014_1 /TAXON_ID=88552 /ORGANISM="Amoebophrya sp., Strain Ameob2" /LENGTH=863 /DNA_ID=CAMNT_0020678119 /DNA_START=198 /DNA_END=2788 /DNA_ORIENTATION=-
MTQIIDAQQSRKKKRRPTYQPSLDPKPIRSSDLQDRKDIQERRERQAAAELREREPRESPDVVSSCWDGASSTSASPSGMMMPSSSESDISSSQLKMSAAGVSSFRHYLGCRKGGRSSEPGSPDVLNMVEELNKKLKSFLHAATEDDSVEVVVGESRVEDSEVHEEHHQLMTRHGQPLHPPPDGGGERAASSSTSEPRRGLLLGGTRGELDAEGASFAPATTSPNTLLITSSSPSASSSSHMKNKSLASLHLLQERVSELERENRELADENVLLRQTRKEGVVIQVNNNQTTSNCLTQVQQGGSGTSSAGGRDEDESDHLLDELELSDGAVASVVHPDEVAISAGCNVEREALASSCASAGARTYNCSTTTTPALCGTPALLREGVSALTQPQLWTPSLRAAFQRPSTNASTHASAAHTGIQTPSQHRESFGTTPRDVTPGRHMMGRCSSGPLIGQYVARSPRTPTDVEHQGVVVAPRLIVPSRPPAPELGDEHRTPVAAAAPKPPKLQRPPRLQIPPQQQSFPYSHSMPHNCTPCATSSAMASTGSVLRLRPSFTAAPPAPPALQSSCSVESPSAFCPPARVVLPANPITIQDGEPRRTVLGERNVNLSADDHHQNLHGQQPRGVTSRRTVNSCVQQEKSKGHAERAGGEKVTLGSQGHATPRRSSGARPGTPAARSEQDEEADGPSGAYHGHHHAAPQPQRNSKPPTRPGATATNTAGMRKQQSLTQFSAFSPGVRPVICGGSSSFVMPPRRERNQTPAMLRGEPLRWASPGIVRTPCRAGRGPAASASLMQPNRYDFRAAFAGGTPTSGTKGSCSGDAAALETGDHAGNSENVPPKVVPSVHDVDRGLLMWSARDRLYQG